MKRENNDILALQFGRLLGLMFEKFEFPAVDLVVPIPTHWRRRMHRRGFHGAAIIAEGLCQVTGLRQESKLLRCARHIAKQATLSTAMRFSNVTGAFAARAHVGFLRRVVRRTLRKVPAEKKLRILLVDDVMTTGATMNEAAKALKKVAASQVFCAVVARGSGLA
jgi:predicted amidophosphoribosyltransferase